MGAFKKMKKLFFCLILLQAFALNAFSHEAPQSSDDYYVVDCAYCYKTGRCNICGGSGVVYFMYMSQYCFSCRGYGKCTYCGGAGKVYIKKQAAPAAGYGGGYSGGYSSGSSSSSSSSSGRNTCKSCNGTGRHPRCNGTGWDGSSSCASCNGTGKCGVCYGRGWFY